MFGIGFWEFLLILIVALLVFGPERLPELARQVGTMIRDLQRMYTNLRAEIGPEFDEFERNIRDLRQIDPRRQVRSYGQSLLNDLSQDAPELKQIATASKRDIERYGRELLGDDLLDQKPGTTSKQSRQRTTETPTNAASTAAADDGTAPASPIEPADSKAIPRESSNGHEPNDHNRQQT
jgi:sec-independent protein translocase protein TatB